MKHHPFASGVLEGNFNVTAALMNFRDNAVVSAENKSTLSDAQYLSLNFVFLFGKNNETAYGLPAAVKKAIKNKLKTKAIKLDRCLPSWCLEIAEAIEDDNSDSDDGDDDDDKDEDKDDEDSDDNDRAKASKIKHSFIGVWTHGLMERYDVESSNREEIVKASSTTSSRKRDSSSSSNNNTKRLLPDLIVKCRADDQLLFDLLVMEVKKKDAKPSQLISDDCKVAMSIKKMIDEQVAFGVKDPVAVGLKVEGEKVEVFVGKLAHEGIYQVHLESHFFLPRDQTEIYSILSALQCLMKVRKILRDLKKRIRECSSNNNSNNNNATPSSWRRPSFDWPSKE
ncbi:hypothetical protein EDC96DRAFT_574213 [Choanephora cucurbitarum]|nr:hypothetical protein EDC96DRAFT_574213 [Choanephora cucurbitarum]